MKGLVLGAALAILAPTSVLADMKELNCGGKSSVNGEFIENEWKAVFDTKDFSKDSPTYEYTLIKYDINGQSKLEYASILGVTYRYPMTVSPSTLSFQYCNMVKRLGEKCIIKAMNMSVMTTVHVNRKDLKVKGLKGNYSCTVEDYRPDNQI